MKFEEKLKMLRKEGNLTQEELADKLCVSRQAITKWENGDGLPDIDNLKELSRLFNTTIDELIKEEQEINTSNINKYRYSEEIDIDHSKHFDIHIGKTMELNIKPCTSEKVIVEIFSNIESKFNIKFDDLYNKMDIDIKNTMALETAIVNILLPEKYINEIEICSKSKTLNISSLYIEKLEYDGELKYLNVINSKGRIVLNATKCDIEAKYDKFDGILEVNTFNSVSRVEIPKDTKYKTILKGVKNEFVDDKSVSDAVNTIELNGIGSKLIIIEK